MEGCRGVLMWGKGGGADTTVFTTASCYNPTVSCGVVKRERERERKRETEIPPSPHLHAHTPFLKQTSRVASLMLLTVCSTAWVTAG